MKRTSSAALCVAAFLQMAGVGLIVTLLPGRVMSLSHSMVWVGAITSAFAVPFVLFQLPVGYLGDRYGYRIFIAAGYALASVVGLLYFRAGSVFGILAGRALQGLAEIPAWAVAPALLSSLYPDTRGLVIGRYNASFHLGLTAGSVASVLASAVWSGGEIFLLYSAAGVLSAVIVALFVEEPARGVPGSGETPGCRDVFRALREIRTPSILAGICLYGGGYGMFLTVVPGVLLREKGFGRSGVAVFFALFYVAISIAQVVAGRISDRRGRNVTMRAGLLLVAAGIIPFAWAEGWTALAFLTAASLGLGAFCVSAMASLVEAVPATLKGSASAVFYVLWGLGYFLAPPALSALGGAVGFRAAFPIVGAVVLAEFAALWANGRAGQ